MRAGHGSLRATALDGFKLNPRQFDQSLGVTGPVDDGPGGGHGRGDRQGSPGNVAVAHPIPGDIGESMGPDGGRCDLPGRRDCLAGIVVPALDFAELGQQGIARGSIARPEGT